MAPLPASAFALVGKSVEAASALADSIGQPAAAGADGSGPGAPADGDAA
ncbi:hypothetical protein [Terrabacter ginsenosidimutans]